MHLREAYTLTLEKFKITRAEISRRAGKQPQYTTDWLNNAKSPTLSVFEQYIAALPTEARVYFFDLLKVDAKYDFGESKVRKNEAAV